MFKDRALLYVASVTNAVVGDVTPPPPESAPLNDAERAEEVNLRLNAILGLVDGIVSGTLPEDDALAAISELAQRARHFLVAP